MTVKIPDGRSVSVDLTEVVKKNDIRRGMWVPLSLYLLFCIIYSLHDKLTQDGLDCGDEVGQLISEFIETTDKRNIRLLYYVEGLPTERDQSSDSSFWLNPVPLLQDTVCFYKLFISIYIFS